MPDWHIDPFPARATPVDWTGKCPHSDELKLHDFWRVGRITITVRHNDFHAHIDDDKTKWGCGKSAVEAIGDVILCHPELVSTKEQIIERTAALASRVIRRPDIEEQLRELE